jgi:hypothetical protein
MRISGLLACMGAVGLCIPAVAQDEFTPPKPTRYHEFLKQFVGTWDVQAKIWTEQGKPPIKSSAIETASLKCAGLWLVYNDKGELGGRAFEGYGMLGYDEEKKKFIGCWVDQTSTSMDIAEGTCDEKGKVFTLISETTDAAGTVTRTKRVMEIKGPDSQSLVCYEGPKGKEVVVGEYEYTRKK